ncbi:energy-coupling factor transporter ATPase [Lentilactobacillus sp. SPB1-3]|uniref:Energy-coupling factor transporter ATPase n=1 Tax=Lentilactobacillus terminaliae TaxID=3003483 RepID=A0ACD5DGR3_9LACO|nr:energy-coupling factor transporter ATPase [Lentilactobacillus sp. SPB1-3]MCZ0976773.1 energy-coupling factor transporter ATPase [Lentilactobacillus sp. SPB1-3]
MDKEISFSNVNHVYEPNSPLAKLALNGVNLDIDKGSFVAIIGHTGSGKSTLIQHINALLKPTSGSVQVGNYTITSKTTNKNLKQLRQHVGMVFQFPEKQLFAESVLKDVMFGPQNYGKSSHDAEDAAKDALQLVNIDEELFDKSPFDLSGGQMRRVAIAGVLAMQPDVLILDEPTAGLDPEGHYEIMQLVNKLNVERHVTIILVTHQMEDVVEYASQVIVMEDGKIVSDGKVVDVFSDPNWLATKQLTLPKAAQFALDLGIGQNSLPLTIDDLAKTIVQNTREDNSDE